MTTVRCGSAYGIIPRPDRLLLGQGLNTEPWEGSCASPHRDAITAALWCCPTHGPPD